jgi:hypothetical protein
MEASIASPQPSIPGQIGPSGRRQERAQSDDQRHVEDRHREQDRERPVSAQL